MRAISTLVRTYKYHCESPSPNDTGASNGTGSTYRDDLAILFLLEARLVPIGLNGHGLVPSPDSAVFVERSGCLAELDALLAAFELSEHIELLEGMRD